jgi:hypothetical protein
VNESFFSRFKAEWGEQVVEVKSVETLRQLVSGNVSIAKG